MNLSLVILLLDAVQFKVFRWSKFVVNDKLESWSNWIWHKTIQPLDAGSLNHKMIENKVVTCDRLQFSVFIQALSLLNHEC